jgi:hypothetical protein
MKLLFPGGVLFAAYCLHAVTVTSAPYNAVGDGQVAVDCSITASSAVLSCARAHFASGDVGKVIAVYDAGPTTNTFLQPLSTTIIGFTDSQHVTLTASATTSASPSSRVVWGTDNTAAIQSAIDAQAEMSGGTVTFPAGMYLVRSVELPCSTIGTFGGHSCTAVYNNITLSGASAATTILENWDITVNNSNTGGGGGILNDRVGVVNLGRWASVTSPNNALSGILVIGITINQVKDPTSNGAKGLSSGDTTNIELSNFALSGPSYEGVFPDGNSIHWLIHDGTVSNAGFGGPGYASTTSCINLSANLSSVYNMTISNCGQGIEMNPSGEQIYNNVFIGPPNFGYGASPMNIDGGWQNSITGNLFINWAGGFVTGGVVGISTQWTITGNTFYNVLSGVSLTGGQEINQYVVPPGITVPPPHGSSVFSNNTFVFTDAAPASPVSYPLSIRSGSLESWTVNNNSIRHVTQVCSVTGVACTSHTQCTSNICSIPVGAMAFGVSGGGFKWTPSTAITGSTVTLGVVRPNIDNGFYYSSTANCTTGTSEPVWPVSTGTVADNTCTWSFAGAYPRAIIGGLSVSGPAGATNFGNDVALGQGSNRRALTINSIQSNYLLQVAIPGGVTATQFKNDAPLSEIIPAGDIYSDTLHYGSGLPTGGVYALAAWLLNGGSNWKVTRAGYAAPVWTGTFVYTFGYFVVPVVDNGFAYMETVASGCTSGSSSPAFPTTVGNTVSDGTCTWVNAGPAVQFTSTGASPTGGSVQRGATTLRGNATKQ